MQLHNQKKITTLYYAFFCIASLWITYLIFLSDLNENSKSIVGTLLVSFIIASTSITFFNLIVKIASIPTQLYSFFLASYYLIGILNISSYRGYIDNYYWLYIVILALFCLWAGSSLAPLIKFSTPIKSTETNKYKINTYFSGLIIFASSLSALVITANHGVLFFNPEARFAVSAKLSYLVEFSLPVTLTIFCYKISRNGFTLRILILPAAVFLMLLSLGYRNQPMLLAAGVLASIFYCNTSKNNFMRFKYLFGAVIFLGLTFLGLSYLVRIDNSIGRTLDWVNTIIFFDVVLPEFTLPFMPLHMAAREGMGVSTIALERIEDISNYVDTFWFFVLDFSTILPDFSLTSGRVLGLVVNLNETSSLTPSLIGGLLISYGTIGVIFFFFAVGLALNAIWIKYQNSKNPRYLSLLVVSLIYMIELTNRGIFKPMYIIAIVLVYLSTATLRSRRA